MDVSEHENRKLQKQSSIPKKLIRQNMTKTATMSVIGCSAFELKKKKK